MQRQRGPYQGTESTEGWSGRIGPRLRAVVVALTRAQGARYEDDRARALAEAFEGLASLYASIEPLGDGSVVVERHLARVYEACFEALGEAASDPSHIDTASTLCRALLAALDEPEARPTSVPRAA